MRIDALPAEGPAARTPPAEVRWGLGDALGGLAASLVVPAVVIGVVVATTGPPGGEDELDDLALWATALLQVPLWAGLLGAPLWATYRKGRRSLAADFGLRARWTDIPLGIGAGLAAQVVLASVFRVVYDVLGVDGEVGESARELTDRATDPLGVVLIFLLAVVGAPLFEELFYRGLLLRSLERRVGTAVAVVASSALFAFLHLQQWYDMPLLFGFALVLAALTVRTGRLGPAVWAHVAFNLTAVVVLLSE